MPGRRPRFLIPAALIVLSALVALGCNGDDDGGGDTGGDATRAVEEETRTPKELAVEIVEDGLLTEDDLPSAEWSVTEAVSADGDTAPGDDGDLFADIEACRDLQEAVAEFQDGEDDTPPLAEGERAFQAGGDDQLMTRSVQSSVIVPADEDDVEDGFEVLREVMDIDTIRPCFEAAFTEALADDEVGIVITALEVSEPETVMEDGVAIALDVDAVAVLLPISLHLEMHFWPEGPAVGQLMLMEMNSQLLQDDVEEILENARERLEEAVEAAQ